MDKRYTTVTTEFESLPTWEAESLYSDNVSPQEEVLAQLRQNDMKDSFDDDDDEDEEEGFIMMNLTPQQEKTSQQGLSKGSKTPVLDMFCTDLTKAAEKGLLDPVVGRNDEIERVAQILSRRKKNNPILIGEPGVGKSAIVEGLAQRIVEHRIARILWDKRVVALDMSAVVAGTKYRGQFEERIHKILKELENNPDIIVFIDEIHTIVGAGSGSGTMDAANLLKPALARGQVQCIGATTINEFRKSIEKDGALDRRFQKVKVVAPSSQETLEILNNLKDRYQKHHNVTYSDQALTACVRLTERYVTDRSFPDKAIDAMDEAGARLHICDIAVPENIRTLEENLALMNEQKLEAIRNEEYLKAADLRDAIDEAAEILDREKKEWEDSIQNEKQVVTEETIAQVVAVMTGIPVQRIGQEESLRLKNLENTLCQDVIGQDDAIKRIAHAIQRSRIGLKDPNRPIGTFLFVGPTGVGKTYLTKRLALEVFGSEDALIRVDMSEYMEKHTVSRMVGAPPGYVGFEEGGQLTERVRRKPYSIVLLDEIEKAHPDIFNILLQVMDEGRLTDGNGVTIDFRNTIIIMTSNCGTRQVREFGAGIGFQSSTDMEEQKAQTNSIVEKALKKQFAPEFLNRLDDIVFFSQLDRESIRKIVDIEMKPLLRRINDLGYELQITPETHDLIAEKGYDVQYGARPLRRAIQTYIENPVTEMILNNEITNNTIKI